MGNRLYSWAIPNVQPRLLLFAANPRVGTKLGTVRFVPVGMVMTACSQLLRPGTKWGTVIQKAEHGCSVYTEPSGEVIVRKVKVPIC